jgi:hypothetical protein
MQATHAMRASHTRVRPPCHVCRDEDVERVVAEALDPNLARVLRLATVQHRAVVAPLLQLVEHFVALALGVDKDDRALVGHQAQLLLQPRRLLVVLDPQDLLRHVFGRLARPPDVDHDDLRTHDDG